MLVALTCKHGSFTADQQEYMTRKAEKLLTFFERVTQINVTAVLEKDRVMVEILVDAEHKHNFVAHGEGPDGQTSFDQALYRMEQQIKKYKEKVQDHRRDRPLGQLAGDAEPSD